MSILKVKRKTGKSLTKSSPKKKAVKTITAREKDIEKSILIYLNACPDCFAWKNNSTGVFDPTKKVFRKPKNPFLINGVSDIIGVYKGRPLFIEVKVPGKEESGLSENQKAFLKQVTRMGALAFVASSVEQVKIILSEGGAGWN